MPHTDRPSHSSARHWLGWLLGAAGLAAVVTVALHLSEVHAFAQQLARLQPGWLLLAVLLQAMTYLAQGQLYRRVAHAGQAELSLWQGARLGLMKLFIDQALPSYGLSGTLAATAAFERHGIRRPVVMACLAVSLTAYLLAYVASLAAALAVTVLEGHATRLLLLAGGLFVLGTLGAGLAVALVAGHPLPARLSRLPGGQWLQRPLAVLAEADARLVRDPRLLLAATGLDLGIVLLDATTLWVLILALGESPSWASVFAGFMLASVLRSIGVTPGGLGLFEAALFTTLSWAGISVPVALSATLLFRGLSFWLPMLPGLLLARGAVKGTAAIPATADSAPWWSWSTKQAFRELDSGPEGLDADRLARHPLAPQLAAGRAAGLGRIFLTQLYNPLMLILVVACLVSLLVAEWLDATIVLAIILLSALLTALQERERWRRCAPRWR